MRKIIHALIGALLLAGVTLGFAATSSPGTATWSWTAPTTNTDGSAITLPLTYKLFVGTAAGAENATPVWTGTALTATTSGYTGGTTVYGYVEACDSAGCSAPSNEASKSFPLPAPGAPSNLAVQ